jgi:Bacterial Ig domain/Putative binding domain, N-terminal
MTDCTDISVLSGCACALYEKGLLMNTRDAIRPMFPWMPAVMVPALVFLVHVPSVSAQSSNPNVVSFAPSPNHSATVPTGEPVVSNYILTFYQAGTNQAVTAVDIGKPAPQADGMIRVDFTTRLASFPLPGVSCDARVSAVGPAGSGTSGPSNTFIYDCTFGLSSTSQTVPAAGGTGTVQVSAGTLCGWGATSSAAWLTVTSGATGVSVGSVGYQAAPNTGSSSRTGVLTIAGLSYTVTQPGAGTNVAPTVRIAQPTDGSAIRLGPPIRVAAEASDPDDQIAQVAFYANGTLIRTVTSAPYALKWKIPAAGTYTLTAVAQDTRGARTTSAPVSITVN